MVYAKVEFRFNTEPPLLSPEQCHSQVTASTGQAQDQPVVLHMDQKYDEVFYQLVSFFCHGCGAPVPGPHWPPCITPGGGEATRQRLSPIATCLLGMHRVSRPSTGCRTCKSKQDQPCCLCTPGGWQEGPQAVRVGREEDKEQDQAGAALRTTAQSLQEKAVSQADTGVLLFSYPLCWICGYGKKVSGSSFGS